MVPCKKANKTLSTENDNPCIVILNVCDCCEGAGVRSEDQRRSEERAFYFCTFLFLQNILTVCDMFDAKRTESYFTF